VARRLGPARLGRSGERIVLCLTFACYPVHPTAVFVAVASRLPPIDKSHHDKAVGMPAFKFPTMADPDEWLATVWRLLDEADQTWRFTKKGDKRPLYDVAKSVASKKRIRAERRQAVMDHILAAARKRNLCRALPGQSIADRMLQAMTPGAWFGMGDIARMAGIHKSGRGKVHQVLLRRGWIEKVKNPGFRGILAPWQIMAGGEPEPQHLYRLTELGLKMKAGLPHQT
jgi:hypothetical protein